MRVFGLTVPSFCALSALAYNHAPQSGDGTFKKWLALGDCNGRLNSYVSVMI
ncbi:uncharacterized protein MYCGRDRAFT_101077 [Zymoseptoria tritici IPO323]|uniref:Uncharacterized protein n=1 Tax=Zymoseptoria tritici (strain CBS 115943 / IPO323) TaxID=336722 RepID=F9XGZ6_ZYMTI|nr:uncharacterized protein MYCGRDRAFT_101077 [Zymoseptoria tritici IPO323]EGP85234.1 hypothetical protein MYCGRDRAFT_101077 [Zymoseptoria tritici IPO323]